MSVSVVIALNILIWAPLLYALRADLIRGIREFVSGAIAMASLATRAWRRACFIFTGGR